MSKLALPSWAKRSLFKTGVNAEAGVNDQAPIGVNRQERHKDRHKPGYMAEYMRKRRAKK